MTNNNFTQNSINAITSAQNTAREYGNPEIKQEHLLYALLTADDSLVYQLLNQSGVDADGLKEAVKKK